MANILNTLSSGANLLPHGAASSVLSFTSSAGSPAPFAPIKTFTPPSPFMPKPSGGGWKWAATLACLTGVVCFIGPHVMPDWLRVAKPTPPKDAPVFKPADCDAQILACLYNQSVRSLPGLDSSALIHDWVRAMLQPSQISNPLEYNPAYGYSFETLLCQLVKSGCALTPECLEYFVETYINPALKASYPDATFNWSYYRKCLNT